MKTLAKVEARKRRHRRVRGKIAGTAERPRLVVHRSNRGISAQLVDDGAARTLAAVSWFEPELRSLAKPERTKRAGQALAERAKAAGVGEAVFDRGGFRYLGHVRAFAEAIRENGLTV